jgi:hypothetical protein
MPKHRRGIVQEGGGEDERDRLGLKIGEPPLEPLAGLGWEAGFIKCKALLQPGIPRDERTLSRLLRAPNEIIGEELLQRRVKFCLWIGFPIGRHEKSRVVLLAGVAAKQILSVVEQEVPLSLTGELGLQTLVDQFDKVGILGRLTSINRQGWSEKQNEKK